MKESYFFQVLFLVRNKWDTAVIVVSDEYYDCRHEDTKREY